MDLGYNINLSEPRAAFVDFDGTLIDNRERLYRLFVSITKSQISFDEYWVYKECGYLQKDVLRQAAFSEIKAEWFKKIWLEQIEEIRWLKYDRLYPGAERFLSILKENYLLYLWTNRQSEEHVIWQLDELGIRDYFAQILATEQKVSKQQLLESAEVSKMCSIVIGDMPEDEAAAAGAGLSFFGISNGIHYKDFKCNRNYDDLLESILR